MANGKEVFEPANKKHYEYLMQNKDVITRNKLFWNRYSIKLHLVVYRYR